MSQETAHGSSVMLWLVTVSGKSNDRRVGPGDLVL